jgi:hypothetical protein
MKFYLFVDGLWRKILTFRNLCNAFGYFIIYDFSHFRDLLKTVGFLRGFFVGFFKISKDFSQNLMTFTIDYVNKKIIHSIRKKLHWAFHNIFLEISDNENENKVGSLRENQFLLRS